VAAYPGGSPDLPDSWDRVKGYTEDLRKKGVEIVPSIDDLLKKVDAVMIESLDGRPHLAQARPVIAAQKPLFIDKPMAASLADVIEIFRLAKQANVPCFSSSSLRFGAGFQAARRGETFGEVRKCIAWGPMSIEPHHPDLFWYGIHGIETLFTIMGTGCATVQRAQTKDTEYAVGVWKDGRIGTFRGIRSGRQDYGAYVFGTKGIGPSGGYVGSGPLTDVIITFFKTGKIPVPPEETIEIYAFMAAADESKKLGGASVSLEEVIKKAAK
jgi:predicted dehydrogenase